MQCMDSETGELLSNNDSVLGVLHPRLHAWLGEHPGIKAGKANNHVLLSNHENVSLVGISDSIFLLKRCATLLGELMAIQ